LSGPPIQVPDDVHPLFHDKDIVNNRVFQFDFLAKYWNADARIRRRLHPRRWEPLLNLATYRYCVFRGSNASAWVSDINSVNGFDETFSYGSDDREFGVRLRNAGVASKWLKYSLCQLHLKHPENRDAHQLRRNRQRFRKLFFSGGTRVEPGIDTAVMRFEQRAIGNTLKSQPHGKASHRWDSPVPVAGRDYCTSVECSDE
jgi:hypothetical protein